MKTSIGLQGYGKTLEGDNKTPVGIYRITSHLTPEQLDDFYGHAAYPVNYPNAWDKMHNRTGFGIWLHAEPMGYKEKTRPLLDSNGCIVLSNNDIDEIKQYIDVGYTYIVMTPKMKIAPVEQVQKLRKAIHKRLDNWQLSWETREPQPYLSFYSKNFSNLEKNWQEWVDYKTRINKLKQFIKIGVSDIGIYAYPGEENMLWVEFYQTYQSSNYLSKGWKRQLWKLESDNVWRIIYEGGG
jgi:murein L,D-transpeptidase YafK